MRKQKNIISDIKAIDSNSKEIGVKVSKSNEII